MTRTDIPFVRVHVDGSMIHMAWKQPLPEAEPTSFDLYLRPEPAKMLPTLYVRHPDGTCSPANAADILAVADTLRPRKEITVTITADVAPARAAIAELHADIIRAIAARGGLA